MAVEFCKESMGWTGSPRISFSHGFHSGDSADIPVDRRHSPAAFLGSSPDFDFWVSEKCHHQSSTADELFSDGKILPLQFKKLSPAAAGPDTEPPELPEQRKESMREVTAPESAEKPAIGTRSFWRFRRSSSLNSGNGHKSSSIWSLQLLLRSKSTGSADQNSKNTFFRYSQKPLSQKHSSNSNSKAVPSSPSTSSSFPSLSQKPPLKKNSSSIGKAQYGAYSNGVRINPVLNVPPPYISQGTTNLFGFGYFFCKKKDKKMKKKHVPP